MAKSKYVGANVVANYDTYATWVDKTNQIIYDLSTSVLTVNTGAVADITTGNAYVNGYFGSDRLYATTELRGGNNTVANTLTISSNVAMSSGAKVTIGATSINSTFYTGTSNVADYLGNTSGSLVNITSWITANASAAYANAIADVSANLSSAYQTTAGLAANVLTLTSGNSNKLLDATWGAPNIIGNVTPNTGYFSVLHSNNHLYLDKNASYVYGTTSDGSQTRVLGISTGNVVYFGAIDNETPVNSVRVHAPNNTPIYFYTNGVFSALITANGFMGIGTLNPAYELDVAGTIKASSTVRVGSATANIVANNTGLSFTNTNITGFLGDITTITANAYTFANSDSGKIVEFANSGATTVTLPNTAPKGFNVMAVQVGTGNVVFSNAAGSTLVKRSGANTGGRYAVASLYVRSNAGATAAWLLAGDTI